MNSGQLDLIHVSLRAIALLPLAYKQNKYGLKERLVPCMRNRMSQLMEMCGTSVGKKVSGTVDSLCHFRVLCCGLITVPIWAVQSSSSPLAANLSSLVRAGHSGGCEYEAKKLRMALRVGAGTP
jgi:hypothetical protein